MLNQEKIIEGCKKNDRKAQKKLYETYAPTLLGICARYANDISEAEDILQEGFLKIFENINDYSGKGHLVGWMKRVMVNTAITNFHKNKKHYYHNELEDVQEDVQIEVTPETAFSTQELNDLLQRLPEGYKMVFNLFAIEGYKHKEIAEMLNIDENTSKTQFLRARKWLIKELAKQEKIVHGRNK
ncbi:MAG: RNA polymerase sigma factor [bacterium]